MRGRWVARRRPRSRRAGARSLLELLELLEPDDLELARRELAAVVADRRHRSATAGHVREVIESSRLDVALQPIIDLTTSGLVGFEALARFPDGLPPDQWFAEARTAGVGSELELLALRTQLALLRAPSPIPVAAYLSVNTSPALVLDPAFHAMLVEPGLPMDRLVVEITEHAAVTRYDEISAELTPYRQRGMRLAVDDTGAGYASFNHVLRLRPDIIKLDRSLLTDIDQDPARRAFVTAIVLMALELGAAVTAEGVERAGELDTLSSLGVDAVQGFLLAPPSQDRLAWAGWLGQDWSSLQVAPGTGPSDTLQILDAPADMASVRPSGV